MTHPQITMPYTTYNTKQEPQAHHIEKVYNIIKAFQVTPLLSFVEVKWISDYEDGLYNICRIYDDGDWHLCKYPGSHHVNVDTDWARTSTSWGPWIMVWAKDYVHHIATYEYRWTKMSWTIWLIQFNKALEVWTWADSPRAQWGMQFIIDRPVFSLTFNKQ